VIKQKNRDENLGTTRPKMTPKKRKEISIRQTGENNSFYEKTHSSETIEHFSNIRKGIKQPPFTEEHKRKSCRFFRRESLELEGGVACEPYCEQWLDQEYKESIMERDGYSCLNPACNKITNKLCIHHINYNKKNCSPFNLITICFSCNSKANFNRDWHKSWYNAIIKQRYLKGI